MGTCYDIEKDTIRKGEPFEIDDIRYVQERTCKMTMLEPPKILAGWWSCSECGPVFPPCNEEIAKWALVYCPHCGAKVIKEKENKMMQPNIDKPIAESLETICVKESKSVSKCIARIMDALDDLASLIADDEHITAEVNKDSVAVSVFKGESFAKTSAALISRQKDSDEWETTVYGSLLEMICHMYDRCCGDGESSLMESIKNHEDN